MKVLCRTNLDLHQAERWPSDLPAVPNVGDRIQSGHVHPGKNFRLSLEVVSVSWECRKNYENREYWIPVIEMHDRKTFTRSIREFYEWYAPLVGSHVSAFI